MPPVGETSSEIISPETSAKSAKRVILLYENYSAALWAMETVRKVIKISSKASLSPWAFPILENPQEHARAAAAATNADLILIASSTRSRTLPASVQEWLAIFLAGPRLPNTPVAALFGHPHFGEETDPRLESVRQTVETATCCFISPYTIGPHMTAA